MNRNSTYHYEDSKTMKKTTLNGIIPFLMAAIFCAMISGCRSHSTIDNAIVHHDTCYVDRLKRDSVHVHDSIYLHEYMRQDTFFIERVRWRTKFIESFKHDSIYIAKKDTVTNTVTIELQRDLTGWQWFQIWSGRLALLLVLAATGILAMRIYLRR